jgi:23S rRNA A2030 N6-methylase RlmJ
MVWYPVKDEQAVAGFHAALGGCGLRRVLVAELNIPGSQGSKRLARCGIAIGNAPWPLEDYLAELMPWLGNLFGGRASWRWVVPD